MIERIPAAAATDKVAIADADLRRRGNSGP
jgi:hypothetical protein